MFCTKCGAKLKEGARFCIYCGQPVEGSQPAQPRDKQPTQPLAQPAQPRNEQPTQPVPPVPPVAPAWEEEPVWEEPKRSHRLLPLWIALAVVALAAVAVIVIQFLPIGEQEDAGRARDKDRAAASASISDARLDKQTDTSASDEEALPASAAEEDSGNSTQTEAEPAGNGADFVPSQTQTDEIFARGGKYTNARFGYTLMVPDGFEASRESENGDGLMLYNEEQDMLITVYGGYQMGESTEELFDQACAQIPGTLGYHVSGEDWYAVSSEDEMGMVHYRKYGAWDGKYRIMELVYPKANAGVCDQLTEELEDGFVSGTQN